MPQATRRWISEKVKSLNESDVLPFHDILDAKMVNAALASAGVTFKERIYTPFVPVPGTPYVTLRSQVWCPCVR
jgi:hypothetical protein